MVNVLNFIWYDFRCLMAVIIFVKVLLFELLCL